jgi:hypothetical protein
MSVKKSGQCQLRDKKHQYLSNVSLPTDSVIVDHVVYYLYLICWTLQIDSDKYGRTVKFGPSFGINFWAFSADYIGNILDIFMDTEKKNVSYPREIQFG